MKSLFGVFIILLISVSFNSSTPFIQSDSNLYNNIALADSSHNSIDAEILKRLEAGEKPNHLIHEKSPYLLMHAFNPVNWYPWGKEAFEKARKENQPIFLSVGYYTCYWCHVMEREIFENDSLAALMNKYFVCIKVDREERPDVDRVYMSALQAMTGSGGWPMTMFLTPDLKPFYGTTYIPPKPSYGRPGFAEVVNAIHDQWVHNRNKLDEIASKVNSYLKKTAETSNDFTKLSGSVLTGILAGRLVLLLKQQHNF